MPNRKYMTEFAYHSFSSIQALTRQGELDALLDGTFGEIPPFHIYMITRRPRVAFKPEAFVFTNERVKGIVTIQYQDSVETREFDITHEWKTADIRVECQYPYTDAKFYDASGRMVYQTNAGLSLTLFGPGFSDLLKAEVLYIGQAFGTAGERTAPMRLKAHETLQRVYSETLRTSPDYEVWIVLLNFDERLMMEMDPTQESTATTEEDDLHREILLRAEPPEDQWINFTEAALITYFMPEYNVMFKGTFPSPAHESYKNCYEFDLNTVAVEVNTESIRTQLYSTKVEAAWFHIAQYELHSPDERKAMFAVFD